MVFCEIIYSFLRCVKINKIGFLSRELRYFTIIHISFINGIQVVTNLFDSTT